MPAGIYVTACMCVYIYMVYFVIRTILTIPRKLTMMLISILSALIVPQLTSSVKTAHVQTFNLTYQQMQQALVELRNNEIMGIDNSTNITLDIHELSYLPIVNNHNDCNQLWLLINQAPQQIWTAQILTNNTSCKFIHTSANKSFTYNSTATSTQDIITLD